MTTLGDLMGAASADLLVTLTKARIASPHAATKGAGLEAALRKFLRDQLPQSIGVTTGHAIDTTGTFTKQLDVILYDALKTPILSVDEAGNATVPVEGVIAVIEVKAHLKADQLDGILENCQSVKNLVKRAYISAADDGLVKFQVYDQVFDNLPIYYSVFAYESDNLYADTLNQKMDGLELSKRIDLVACLGRGVNMNMLLGNPMADSPVYLPHAQAGTQLVDLKIPNPLLLWFAALSTVVFQARTKSIDLLAYAHDELTKLTATLPGGGHTATNLMEQALHTISQQTGLDVAIFKKIVNPEPEPLTAEEINAVASAGLTFMPDPDKPEGYGSISTSTPPQAS